LNLLVTGGCGFIGSNFLRLLRQLRPDWRLMNIDALRPGGRMENIQDLAGDTQVSFVRGDINDRALIEPLIDEADAIVNFAAESHVDRSILDAAPFVESNVRGVQSLLDAMRTVDPESKKRLVHVSTDEVYGSLSLDDDHRFTEASPLRPSSPYSASKAGGDLLILAACRTFNMNACVTRCGNNFGPRQFPEKLIPLIIDRALRGLTIPIYGDGRQVRDWIHVDDHGEALLHVLEQGQPGEVFNIGADNEQANLDVARLILDAVGASDELIRYVADRPGHDRRYSVDASRLMKRTGWRPTRSTPLTWPEALREVVRWYTSNRQWFTHVEDEAYRAYMAAQYANRLPH